MELEEETPPPFTEDQIAWLDARYRKSTPQIERELQAAQEPDGPAG